MKYRGGSAVGAVPTSFGVGMPEAGQCARDPFAGREDLLDSGLKILSSGGLGARD